MRKYVILFLLIGLSVSLFTPGCKALSGDGNGNGEINVAGTWTFTNVLKTNPADSHERTFILTGDKNSGTVSETISPTTGPYTVTATTQFRMDLTNFDAVFRWTYEYVGTIADNSNMSGTLKTTTYPAAGGNPIGVFEYNYTAKRQK